MRAISRPWAAPIEHDRGHREDHSLRREFALGQDLVGQAADENPSWRSKFAMQDHAKSKIETSNVVSSGGRMLRHITVEARPL